VTVALACIGAGLIISVITNTGIGLALSSVIVAWSGGKLFFTLFLIMVTSLILGMGLPCTPAYIIAVAVGAPALIAMGSDLLAAHLFVFYFAILAAVTPPVAIAAYAAASIAGSDPLKTGFAALKLAVAGFIIPYVFMYNPALLLKGSVLEILTSTLLMVISYSFCRWVNRVLGGEDRHSAKEPFAWSGNWPNSLQYALSCGVKPRNTSGDCLHYSSPSCHEEKKRM